MAAGFASGNILLLLSLVAVIALPILLRPAPEKTRMKGARALVIVTPHIEAIRHEFGRAFARRHLQRTGEQVLVDWRTPGGTSEIARYVEAEYIASFQQHWTQTLRRPWSAGIERAFADAKLPAATDAATETPEQAARREFLSSRVSCGIDLFFGGGSFDYAQQAAAGRLVKSGLVAAHPELFGPRGIPQKLGGEPFWDAEGRWIGTCLSAFGICYNRDVLGRLGIAEAPRRWADLASPSYEHGLALANPTQSSSVNKAFEMLIQQQMLEHWEARQAAASGGKLAPAEEAAALGEGWEAAMRLLLKIGANAKYFSDASSKIALDVAAGEAVAGMTIDFYGRFESEAVRGANRTSRVGYANAERGTSFGADPIGLFRGAPNAELAREFMEWVLSPEGQQLWDSRVGTPGGPERYALRRLPILPALYAPGLAAMRSDPEVNPYAAEAAFVYHDRWTGPLFRPIAFMVRAMCIDPHEEARAAWREIVAAGFPAEALAAFSDVSAVDYSVAQGRVRSTLAAGKLAELQLARELSEHFRAQYLHAAALARAGR